MHARNLAGINELNSLRSQLFRKIAAGLKHFPMFGQVKIGAKPTSQFFLRSHQFLRGQKAKNASKATYGNAWYKGYASWSV